MTGNGIELIDKCLGNCSGMREFDLKFDDRRRKSCHFARLANSFVHTIYSLWYFSGSYGGFSITANSLDLIKMFESQSNLFLKT